MPTTSGSNLARTRNVLLLFGLLADPAICGEARIVGIVHQDVSIDDSAEVHCLRATDVEERQIRVGMELEIDDVLEAKADGLSVRITCGEQTVQNLSGRFVAAILAPGDDDCAIRLDEGRSDLTTSLPARVEGAGVVLGNRATQYAVDRRAAGGFPPRAIAFDGAVYARSATDRANLATGFALDLPGPGILGASARIGQHDFRRSAATAAGLDVAEAIASRGAVIPEPSVTAAELEGLHYAVLADPRDPGVRKILADAQIRLRLYDRARYHLRRLEEIAGGTTGAWLDSGPSGRQPQPFFGYPPAPSVGGTLAEVDRILDGLEPPPAASTPPTATPRPDPAGRPSAGPTKPGSRTSKPEAEPEPSPRDPEPEPRPTPYDPEPEPEPRDPEPRSTPYDPGPTPYDPEPGPAPREPEPEPDASGRGNEGLRPVPGTPPAKGPRPEPDPSPPPPVDG